VLILPGFLFIRYIILVKGGNYTMKKDIVRAVILAIIVIVGFWGISLFRPEILEQYSGSRVVIILILFVSWAVLVILAVELIREIIRIIQRWRNRKNGLR